MKVIQLTLALLAVVAVIECGIVLTGHADVDFSPSNPSFASDEVGAIGEFLSFNDFIVPDYMSSRNRENGMDVKYVRTFYDYKNDNLYVGIQCKGICGDTDGNENPSTVDPGLQAIIPTYGDDARGCLTESYSIQWWNNMPTDYDNQGDINLFFPQFVTADSLVDCIVDSNGDQQFVTYEMPNFRDADLQWDVVRDGGYTAEVFAHRLLLSSPDDAGAYQNALRYSNLYPSIPALDMLTLTPSLSQPHIEFVLRNFSKYPGNEYMTPGAGYFRTGIRGIFYASSDDPIGEDYLDPVTWQFEYDCAGIPAGGNVYDDCGICGGNGLSCADCLGTPNGNATYDSCGICDGDDSQCLCNDYLGFSLQSVDYALLRWSVSASLYKINDTLEVLKSIRSSLRDYDYVNGDVPLNDYIDVIHDFCDNCLDNFDDAQLWFSEVLSGACDGLNCESPFENQVRWSL